MKKYIFLFLASLLINGFAKALPIISRFTISNVTETNQFILAGFGVSTPFTGSVIIQRSINCAAPTTLESVDIYLTVVFSSSGNPSDPLNVPLSDSIHITSGRFALINPTTAAATFSAVMPPATRKGVIMLVTKTYPYLNGTRQATPIIGYSTAQYTVVPYLPDNAIMIVPDVRARSADQGEGGIPATCTRCFGTPSRFDAPTDNVLTGKKNTGGREGTTSYEYASLKAIDAYGNRIDGTITLWSIGRGAFPRSGGSSTVYQNDSSNLFTPQENYVATGREHLGNTQKIMSMAYAYVLFNGQPTKVLRLPSQQITLPDANGIGFVTGKDQILTTVQTTYQSSGWISTYTPGVIYYIPNDSIATRIAPQEETIAMTTPVKPAPDATLVYPNPTRNVFNITGLSMQKNVITVMDAKGNRYKQLTTVGPKASINLSGAPAGVYFIKIQQQDGSFITKKLIKQ